MKSIFPDKIRQMPKADIPIEGLKAYLSQADTHQIIFMLFIKIVELPEHEHSDQIGFILEGKFDLTIDGKTKNSSKGDKYNITAGIRHSAKI